MCFAYRGSVAKTRPSTIRFIICLPNPETQFFLLGNQNLAFDSTTGTKGIKVIYMVIDYRLANVRSRSLSRRQRNINLYTLQVHLYKFCNCVAAIESVAHVAMCCFVKVT